MAFLARMVEFGLGPAGLGSEGAFDLRKWILGGASSLMFVGNPNKPAHLGGGTGPQANVKFDFTRAKIKAAQARMGGRGAMAAAQRLAHTTSRGSQPVYGGRYTPGKNAPTGRRVRNPTSGLRHRTNLLSGMVRLGSTYSRASGGARTQTSGYRTWRRASWTGQPWMHPGYKARRIGDRVLRRLDEILRRVL